MLKYIYYIGLMEYMTLLHVLGSSRSNRRKAVKSYVLSTNMVVKIQKLDYMFNFAKGVDY